MSRAGRASSASHVIRSSPHAGVVISIRSLRLAAMLVATICYISLVSNSQRSEALAAGIRLSVDEAEVGSWQYVREGLTLLLLTVLLLAALRVRRAAGRTTIGLSFALFSFLMGIQFIRALIDPELGFLVAAIGLRLYVFAALLLAFRVLPHADRMYVLRLVGWLLLPFVAVQVSTALLQVATAPPTAGRTFFGSRPWGTMSSPNKLGLTMVSLIALYAVVGGRLGRIVIPAAVAVAVLSGSRTSMLAAAAILVGMVVARWRMRLAIVPALLLGLLALYVLSSGSALSGRDIEGEARLDTWANALTATGSFGDLLFGAGLGVGTNASRLSFDATSSQAGGAVSDSMLVATLVSLGLLGLFFVLYSYVRAWVVIEYRWRFALLPAVGILAISFNIPELSPINLLLALTLSACMRRVEEDSSPGRRGLPESKTRAQ